jgi:hypothetical protein
MPAIKIMCLGGGSLYFRRVLGNLVLEEQLAESDILLYDIDPEKAERMAALGRRLAEAAGTRFNISSTADPDEAVDGADYALSSIGGSGAEITKGVHGSYYHSADLHIAAKYGIQFVVGDTCGPAGMMMGLRSISAQVHGHQIGRALSRRARGHCRCRQPAETPARRSRVHRDRHQPLLLVHQGRAPRHRPAARAHAADARN